MNTDDSVVEIVERSRNQSNHSAVIYVNDQDRGGDVAYQQVNNISQEDVAYQHAANISQDDHLPLVSKPDAPSAAVCVIVVNEEAYINEWVDFHLAIGFSHIYVYDNSADFEMRQWGEERASVVTIRHYPSKDGPQNRAYKDCAQRHGEKHRWLGFFDADEFLVLRKHKSVVDLLTDHLPNGGSLGVRWIFLGCRGQTYHPLPVTWRFRQARLPLSYDRNRLVKALTESASIRTDQEPHPHYSILKPGKTLIDTDGRGFAQQFENPGGPTDVAAFYHFAQKSLREYLAKIARGRADVGTTNPLKIRDIKQFPVEWGADFDDGPWQQLLHHCPAYKLFEESLAGTAVEPMMEATLCSRVGPDDEFYLDEWVDYHRALGFGKIVLYDDSEDLKEWTNDKQGVTLRVRNSTDADVQDCIEQAHPATEWVASMDVDEFLVLGDGKSLREFLLGQSRLVVAERRVFGTAGRLVYEPKPVTKRFQLRQANSNKAKFVLVQIVGGRTAPTKEFGGVTSISDEVVDPAAAVVHHYTKSMKEHSVRASIERPLPSGGVEDESAWLTMKRLNPKYAVYDGAFCNF